MTSFHFLYRRELGRAVSKSSKSTGKESGVKAHRVLAPQPSHGSEKLCVWEGVRWKPFNNKTSALIDSLIRKEHYDHLVKPRP